MTLNSAALAPTPNATVRIAASAKAGLRRSERTADRIPIFYRVRSLKEREVRHGVMLSIEGPKLCPAGYCASGDERVRNLHAMGLSVLPQINTGLTSGFLVNRDTTERSEKVARSVVFIRPGTGPFGDYVFSVRETLRSEYRNQSGLSLLIEPIQTVTSAQAPNVLHRIQRLRTSLANSHEILHCLHLFVCLIQITLANGSSHDV